MRTIIAMAVAMLAWVPTARADEAAELQPSLQVQLAFGGCARGLESAALLARLDHPVLAAASADTPAVLQWRLDTRAATVELYGMPLGPATPGALNSSGDENRTAKAIMIGVLSTLAAGAAAAYLFGEAMEGLGEAMAEDTSEAIWGGSESEEDDPPGESDCTVQVGDDCLGG